MILKNFLFLNFFLFIFTVHSQKKNLETVDQLIFKGELNMAFKIADSLLKYDISLYERGYLTLYKAKVLRLKGKNETFVRELETVFKIADKIDNKILEANALMQKITFLNNKKGEGLPALAKYVTIAENTQNIKLLYNAYIILTAYSLKGNDIKKAKKFYNKILNIDSNNKKKIGNQEYLNLMYANILNREKKYDSAIFYLKKVLLKTIELKKNVGKTQALSLLGNRALKNKNFIESYEWSSQSNKLANKINSKLFIESSYANMFMLLVEVELTTNLLLKQKIYTFFEANSFKSAILNVEKRLPKIKKSGQKLKLLDALSSSYQKIGNFKKALYYKNEWSKMNIEKIEKDQLNITRFMDLQLAISNLNKEKLDLEIKDQLNFTHKIILALSTIIIFILGLFFWYKQKLKTKSEKISKIIAEINLLKETKEKIDLEKTLADKELELNAFIKDMIEKNSQIKILENELKNSKSITSEELLSNKASITENWSQFVLKFKQIHPSFLNKVKLKNPKLSKTEMKLSMLVFLNLTGKEIGNLLNISPTSVNQGKYRLKKKLNINKEKSITQFFQEL